MSTDTLVGLLFSIPLAIIGNFATVWVQRFLTRRSEKRTRQRIAQLREEYAEIAGLSADANKHQIFLLESVLLITLLTTFVAVAATLSFVIHQLTGARTAMLVGWMILLGGGIAVTKECLEVLRKSTRVRRFDNYAERVHAEISTLENPRLGATQPGSAQTKDS
ncbi:hypothetical protein ACA040_002232 [Xenophilus aerolatus]